MSIEYDKRLVEDLVFLGMRSLERQGNSADFALWRSSLDAIYEDHAPGHLRDAAFDDLHARFFSRLELDLPLREVLVDFPMLISRAAGFRVCLCVDPKSEGADLFRRSLMSDASAKPDHVVLRCRADRFLAGVGFKTWLRRELYHASDMLDPDFAYGVLASDDSWNPGRETLVRDRYTALWNVWIDVRLAKAGLLSAEEEVPHEQILDRVFHSCASLAGRTLYSQLQGASRLSHQDLMAWAIEGSDERIVSHGTGGEVKVPR